MHTVCEAGRLRSRDRSERIVSEDVLKRETLEGSEADSAAKRVTRNSERSIVKEREADQPVPLAAPPSPPSVIASQGCAMTPPPFGNGGGFFLVRRLGMECSARAAESGRRANIYIRKPLTDKAFQKYRDFTE